MRAASYPPSAPSGNGYPYILTLLLGVLLGCGGEGAPERSTASQEVPDSVAFEHPAGALDGAPSVELESSPAIRIGTDEGPFSNVSAGRIISDGTLVLLDGDRREVLVFDSGGELVRSMGERGEGPGEFETPAGMSVSEEAGTVSVWDSRFQRMAVFRLEDGSLVDDRRLPVARVFSMRTPSTGGPTVLLAMDDVSMPPGGGRVAPGHRMLRWHREKDSVVELARFPGGEFEVRVVGGTTVRPIANRWYQRTGYAVAARDGVWRADGWSWTLRRLRYAEGGVDRVVRFDEPVEPIDEGLIGRFFDAELARAEPERREWVRTRHEGTEYPEYLPTVRGLRLDGAGRVWIHLPETEDLMRAPERREGRWVILADEGARVVGQLTLPAGRRLMDAGEEGVLTSASTELGAPVVEWWPFEGS